METIKALETFGSIKPGTFFRVLYQTEPKLKKEFREQGIKVVKVTGVTLRTGVKYANINGVEVKGTTRENNFSWLLPYKISHNSKTGKDYLNAATCKRNAYPHTTYYLVNGSNRTEITKEDLINKGYIQDSYWNQKDSAVRLIALENIINIGKVA